MPKCIQKGKKNKTVKSEKPWQTKGYKQHVKIKRHFKLVYADKFESLKTQFL